MNNIEDIMNDILSKKHTKEFYSDKYEEFSKTYPTLFDKLFEPDLDTSVLRYMINQMNKMNAHKQTEYDASVKVGTMLVDKFVKPNLA